ncbi:MAG: tetrapyrrole methylase [Sphingobacteriia bacterium]|nr:tetrapyrrole methylase [Sphingobacteriia bacterium]
MISSFGRPRRAAIHLLGCLLLIGAPLAADTAAESRPSTAKSGHLYLVSVGVGDPDNITVRAQKTLAEADIVFGMEGTRERFADLLQGKETYEAGHGLFRPMHRQSKPESREGTPAALNQGDSGDVLRQRRGQERPRLEAQARQVIREAVAAGKTVAVLDNGDPTIYAPHTGYLTEFADLNPTVIPGLSSFNAANAALGRAITQGEHSRSVILTRTPGDPLDAARLDNLETLAKSRSTLVFFTMRSKFSEFVDQLKAHYPGETPIAIVAHAGYRQDEQVITATLDTILERVGGEKLPFEHLIYVGDFLK